MELGVYVHFPWCRRLCPYCDFPVVVVGRGGIPHQAYLDVVLAELHERTSGTEAGAPGAAGAGMPVAAGAGVAGRRLVSIYLGGGTPSLWEPACLAVLIERICAVFGARPGDLEVTIEANPTDCTAERMAAWQAAGINRLSIGVQSVEPAELRILGRDHRMGDGAAALVAALGAGFTRISADIIMGVPGSAASAVDTVLAVAASGIGHLSVYELTIEERTAFGRAARAGRLVLDDDALADTYVAVDQALAGRGFEHYEISSYAQPGQRAVHNQLYWTGGEFLGLGPGAASFQLDPGGGGERRTNVRSAHAYMRARGLERAADRQQLSAAEVAADRLWLGMRTRDGVPRELLAADSVAWLLSGRLAEPLGDRIRPTLRGFLYSNRIASRLFGEER